MGNNELVKLIRGLFDVTRYHLANRVPSLYLSRAVYGDKPGVAERQLNTFYDSYNTIILYGQWPGGRKSVLPTPVGQGSTWLVIALERLTYLKRRQLGSRKVGNLCDDRQWTGGWSETYLYSFAVEQLAWRKWLDWCDMAGQPRIDTLYLRESHPIWYIDFGWVRRPIKTG